ncbi:MAG: ankyrin repeat domain-containing protein [Spirochaetales bacterium]|nr:ankyrin repeat domain-containing protein [Spirochaetales bacterium]
MELKTGDLHKAAAQSNIDDVVRLIGRGDDVNAVDLNGHTPLHLCSGNNGIPVAQALLDAGANIEAFYVDKKLNIGTPLLEAASSGDSAMAAFLLAKGADVEAKNLLHRSPLDITCYSDRGDLQTVKVLLEAGADCESVNKEGETPLYSALRSGKIDIAEYLISKGANILFKKQTGRNILFCLAAALPRYCFDADIEIDSEGGFDTRINFLANNGMSISIAYQGDGIADEYIKDGVIGDEKAKAEVIEHCIPYLNKKKEYMRLAGYCIEKGVDISDTDLETGTTLLMLACDVNCPVEFIELLVDRGIDISAKDSWGLTALHYVCRQDNISVLELLLAHGADTDIADDMGFTPLHEAAEHNNCEAVRLLLENGADTSKALTQDYEVYKQGFTPLDIASIKGHEECASLLKEGR